MTDRNIPCIAFGELDWEETEPGVRIATIQIGTLLMHLEAIEVEDADGEWEAVGDRQEVLETIEELNDAKSETRTLDGREHVLWAVPFGR